MMRYFQTPNGQIFAIEKGQEHVIPKDGVEKTESEAMAIANPPPTVEQLKQSVRNQRDSKLKDTDWRVIKAQETGIAMSQAWQDYRQALRDITNQTGFPENVDWPTEPTE